MELLKRGSKGEEVKRLQRTIGQLEIDGDFGPKTERWLKDYQKHNGLQSSGVLDDVTATLLYDIGLDNLKDTLGEIGWRAGHSDYDNLIDSPWAKTPEEKAYREGRAMRQLATEEYNQLGGVNIRTTVEQISFSEAAKRAVKAGCSTLVCNHTNWSLDRNGHPNRGTLKVIYSIFREHQLPIYEKIAETLANELGLQWVVTTRKSKLGVHDYYGAINQGIKAGIKFPFIIEHGYHLDFAPDVGGNIQKVCNGWKRLIKIDEVEPPAIEPSKPVEPPKPNEEVKKKLLEVKESIDKVHAKIVAALEML